MGLTCSFYARLCVNSKTEKRSLDMGEMNGGWMVGCWWGVGGGGGGG